MFFDYDTLELNKDGMTRKTSIADQTKIKGREVIIYFNPFTPTPDEEYKLYLEDNLTHFTAAKIVGELHFGVSKEHKIVDGLTSFNGGL